MCKNHPEKLNSSSEDDSIVRPVKLKMALTSTKEFAIRIVLAKYPRINEISNQS